MRDGRLGDAERASYERHLTSCAACAREVVALDALAASLRRPGSSGETDELLVRRERTRLLAAFDELWVAPRRQRPLRQRVVWAAAAALIACLLVFVRLRRSVPGAELANAVVRPDAAAVWSEHTEGDLQRVRLERGSLWIHVDHASGRGRRLVVVLPDGELEDMGTTFTVSAEDGRTTRVTVEDGSVTLRQSGHWAVSLGAGEMWTPVAQPVASTSSAPAAVPAATTGAASIAAPIAQSTAPSSTSGPRSVAPTPSGFAPAKDPAVEFRAAMASLDTGDNRTAATSFASFLQRHPADPRAEDAAYLEVIALQRCGDRDAMRVAGQAYLRRFPAGFRRAEVKGSLEDAGL